MLNVYEHFKISGEEGIMLSYKGKLSGDLIALLLQFVEANFNEMQASAKVRKRVVNILIESLQNIYHHTTNIAPNTMDDDCMLVLMKKPGFYSVITGNHIAAKDVAILKARMEEINQLDMEGLGEKYRAVLSKKEKPANPSSTGAGIGIIDMARRSGQQMDYSFEKVNDKLYFFGLEIKVKDE